MISSLYSNFTIPWQNFQYGCVVLIYVLSHHPKIISTADQRT